MLNFLRKVCRNLEDVRGASQQVEKIKAVFNESEALSSPKRLIQQIILAILNLLYPKEVGQLSAEVNIPLLGFETPDEVVSYLDAVIRSGTSVDEKSGTVFLMGNTAHCVLSYDQLKVEIFNQSLVRIVANVLTWYLWSCFVLHWCLDMLPFLWSQCRVA